MPRDVSNPERDALNAKLDAVRSEQLALFSKKKRNGLLPREHVRLADLGRTEIALMAAKASAGRRVIGQKHHRR